MQEDPLLSEVDKPVEIKDLSLNVVVTEMNIGTLETNAKDVLATIKRLAPLYKAENYSEDNLQKAKDDRAAFNNLAKGAVETRTVKRTEFLVPFMPYSDTVDEIVKETKTVSGIIDTVIRDVEKREKDKKGNLISEFFDGLKIDTFVLSQIWNPAWLNKGSKIKDIQNEIIARNAKVNADLIELDALAMPEVKASYLASLDMEAARKDAARIKENRERLAKLEADRKAEADRIEDKRVEDEKARLSGKQDPIEPVVSMVQPEPLKGTPEPQKSYSGGYSISVKQKPTPDVSVTTTAIIEPEKLYRQFEIWASLEELEWLSNLLYDAGIKFQKIEQGDTDNGSI